MMISGYRGYSYPCDDKAVHWYSAACLFAQSSDLSIINHELETAWLDKLPVTEKKQRLIGRINGWGNYLVADCLIRSFDRMWNRGRGEILGFSQIVRTVFLVMLVVAVGFLWLVAYRVGMLGECLLAIGIMICGLSDMSLLAPAYGGYDAFVFVPRGSACFLATALFVAGSYSHKRLFLVSALLLASWHAGLSVLVFVAMFGAFMLEKALLRRSVHLRDNVLILSSLLILVVTIGVISHAAYSSMPVSMSIMGKYPKSSLIRIILATALEIGVLWVFVRNHSIVGASRSRLLILGVSFLIIVDLVETIVALQSGSGWLQTLSRNHLISEVPARLSGVRQSIFAVLVATLIWLAIEWLRLKCVIFRPLVALICLCAVILVANVLYVQRYEILEGAGLIRVVVMDDAGWGRDEGISVERAKQMTALPDMDPKQESTFFLGLSEWLGRKR